MKIKAQPSYYTDCLEAALSDGIQPGNYLNAIADCILYNAQAAIRLGEGSSSVATLDAFDVLASARGQLRRETPDNPYFE